MAISPLVMRNWNEKLKDHTGLGGSSSGGLTASSDQFLSFPRL